jgi:hypothetical protein
MSQNMQTLLATAAELRSGGHSWDYVASQVHRSVQTVRQWPTRFEVQWTLLYQKAQKKRQTEAAAEALNCLRNLLNEEDVRVRIKAADSLLKLSPASAEPDSMSEREMEVRKALERIDGAIEWYTPRLQAERKRKGLAPLSGKELEEECIQAFNKQMMELQLSSPEYQVLQQFRQQQQKESENAKPESNSTSSIQSIHPLILLWLLVSTLFSGVLGVREYQRQSDSVGLASRARPSHEVSASVQPIRKPASLGQNIQLSSHDQPWCRPTSSLLGCLRDTYSEGPASRAEPSVKVSEGFKYCPEAAFCEYVLAPSHDQPYRAPEVPVPCFEYPEPELSISLVRHLEPLLYFGINIADFG